MELLIVDSEALSDAVVVRANGKVGSSTVEKLVTDLVAALRQAANHAARLLVVDLQGLTYFGSAGLNAVLDCHNRGAAAGMPVRLVADNPLVVRPIQVTGLDSVLRLYPTLTAALDDRP
jgi:anti-anti-sigma factor